MERNTGVLEPRICFACRSAMGNVWDVTMTMRVQAPRWWNRERAGALAFVMVCATNVVGMGSSMGPGKNMPLEECIIVRRISTERGPAWRKGQCQPQKDAGRRATQRTYKVPSPSSNIVLIIHHAWKHRTSRHLIWLKCILMGPRRDASQWASLCVCWRPLQTGNLRVIHL